MSTELVRIGIDASLEDAASLMVARQVGAVLVEDGAELKGILTERDILRAVAAGAVATGSVKEWMTRDPETVEPTDTTSYAARLLIHGGFRHLPVMDDGILVGMISVRDLMRTLIPDDAPRGV